MAACSPQRFLANNRNLFRGATITADSVLPVVNQVVPQPRARSGTAQASLTGTYTGQESATYEFEILDEEVEVARVSAPTFAGIGSGRLSDISATGVQQVFLVECADAGTPAAKASVTVSGQTIRALLSGTVGNTYRITVDLSGLTYTDSDYSLLTDAQAGQGSQDSPFVGQGFDFGAVALDANGLIPTSAPRISFGDDPTVYLHYKNLVEGVWKYYLVPGLAQDVPKGTRVKTVAGGRTVAITDGSTTDTFTDIKTDYDFLYAVRTQSTLVYVDGIVANDRSPTGQAAREFSLRTDAHAEASTGSGSSYATGLTNVTVAADAGQQLVTLTCFAVSAADHPSARLGHELWQAKSSLLGDLGIVATGERFDFGDVAGLIPVKTPPGYGAPKGSFSADVSYASRSEGETEPPICPVAMTLGGDPVDGTYTFVLTARPSGDCDCTGMPVPRLNSSCLGSATEGGEGVDYQPDTIERLVDLHEWFKDTVRTLSAYPSGAETYAGEAPAVSNPFDAATDVDVGFIAGPFSGAQATESLREVVANFEATAAQIDPLTPASPPAYREAGFDAWDDAVTDLKADIAACIGSSSPIRNLFNIPSDRYDAALNLALISAGLATVGKTDASTVSGDGCWRDWGDAAYWKNTDGDLLPMFTNHPYIASRLNAAGRAFSTHNFGLQLNVKCPEDLKLGDTITLTIANASWGSAYHSGDIIEQPIVSAAPLYLTGGVTGNPVQTWNVSGSVKGPYPPYSFNPDTPAAYTETVDGSTVSFLLDQRGIAFAKGDRHRFAVEGGHYQWRKNGGAWDGSSPPLPIPLEADLIDAGLSVAFTAGAARSFVTGDVFEFRARQPWALSNTATPSLRKWRWSGATAEYSADLGSAQQLDLVALLADLPDGASITLDGGLLAADEWSETITVRAGCSWKAIDRIARYVKITFADATDGSLQFPWIGVPLSTSLSADVMPARVWRVNKPGGNLQGGRFVGKTISGSVGWTEAALTEADAQGLIDMLDWVKEHHNEPLLVIPQITRTADPVIVARVDADQIEFVDHAAYNQSVGVARRVSCTIPLDGVLA